MYMVHFGFNCTKRYDDAAKMGRDIASWLSLNPGLAVKVVMYVN